MNTWKGYVFKIGKLFALVSPLGFVASEVYAAPSLALDNISNSYSNCFFQDNGNGTSTVSTVVDYKNAQPSPPTAPWQNHYYARGVAIYNYDKDGRPNMTSFPATSVDLNGVHYTDRYLGSDYALYQRTMNLYPNWQFPRPFSATFTAVIPNSNLLAWPAISIRAANVVNANTGDGRDVAEIKGAAYIVRGGSSNGTCKVIVDPSKPPPLDINITVSAPDWNLGDLQQGQSDTTFSRSDQQLCFSYSAADVQNKKFVVSASNANGVVNNRYQLRHLSDTSQVVPYSLTLDSGGTRLQLPNNSTALTLDGGNRTCFVPTFRTEVEKTVKEGDYNDVLNFTVSAKS